MSEAGIYLMVLDIAKHIAMEYLDKEDAEGILTVLDKLLRVRSFGFLQTQS